eukprot:415360_1
MATFLLLISHVMIMNLIDVAIGFQIQLKGTCDNAMTVWLSQDGTEANYHEITGWNGDLNEWAQVKSVTTDIPDLTAKIKIECRNWGCGAGGLIFSIEYDGQWYSTDGSNNNNGYYALVDSKSRLTTSLDPGHPWNINLGIAAQWTWTCGVSDGWNCGVCDEYNTYVLDFALFATSGPTNDPTQHPSQHPSRYPSQYPTTMPTFKHSMELIKNGRSCRNLPDHSKLIYEINLEECIHHCQVMGDSCRMINFYYHFKTHHDSRCYIFDDICYVVPNNNNQTTIYYKSYDKSCANYPYDWRDNIGDNCDAYKAYSWCENGAVLRHKSNFDQLVDSKYNLTAINTCCECGGGINIIDDVAFSVDEYWNSKANILCNGTPSLHKGKSILRAWDNLILYQLCGYLDLVNCTYLLDSQFQSRTYAYSMYLCNDHNTISHPFQFIVDHKIDVISLKHDIYVNLLWFDIDVSYYSTDIDIIYMNYSQCVATMMGDNVTNNANHGLHPCYTQDTSLPTANPMRIPTLTPTLIQTKYPTLIPTKYPTLIPTKYQHLSQQNTQHVLIPTKYPTLYIPTKYPTSIATYLPDHVKTTASKDLKHELVSALLVIVIILILFVVILFMSRKFNKQNTTIAARMKKIEMQMRTITSVEEADEAENLHTAPVPSAPYLSEEKQDLLSDLEQPQYCIICCDNVANMFNYPCGHVTYCNICVGKVTQHEDKCPNCRQSIFEYKQIYKAGFVHS